MNSTLTQKDIFGPGSRFQDRLVETYAEMDEKVRALHQLNQRIVLTMGAFDIFHIGHARYLERAKERGDVLIVGVDSDEKVKERKGPNRPLVPEAERLEVLTHVRHVDLVFLKNTNDSKWQLIKTVKPDVLIAIKENYNQEQLGELKEFCGEVVVLERQATTATTAKIRLLLVGHLAQVEEAMKGAGKVINEQLREVLSIIEQIKGGRA